MTVSLCWCMMVRPQSGVTTWPQGVKSEVYSPKSRCGNGNNWTEKMRCPGNSSSFGTVLASAAKTVNPFRKSVTPAVSQSSVFAQNRDQAVSPNQPRRCLGVIPADCASASCLTLP